MKTLALVCNIASVAFTLFVLATDGPATKPIYQVFLFLLLAVPIVTVIGLLQLGAADGTLAAIRRTAAAGNIVLLGFVCWALVDQHPHPSEPGFVPYAVLIVLAPVLGAIALLHRPPLSAARDRAAR